MSFPTEIQNQIRNFGGLPIMSEEVLTLLQDPDVDYAQLAEKMRYDPGMTANVLGLANSAYFGLREGVDSLQRAFVFLGRRKIFQLVIAHSTSKFMQAELPGYGLERGELLKHAVWGAIAAEETAAELEISSHELLFTAALLRDIGKVALDSFVQEKREELLNTERENSVDEAGFEQREASILGMSHTEAGAELLQHWGLPEEIVTAVKHHHWPAMAEQYQNLVFVIHFADIVSYSAELATGIDAGVFPISNEVFTELGITEDTVDDVMQRTEDKMEELVRILA